MVCLCENERMMDKLVEGLRLLSALLVLLLNTVVHITLLLLVALVKACVRIMLPLRGLRTALDHALIAIAESWIGVNSLALAGLTNTRIAVEGLPEVDRGGHYLVLCNHQSWVDIPVLQRLFNRRLPFMRFFLKQQLIWVPLLGLAWWALDFPFMHRHSKQQLAQRPQLAGRDLAATRRACEKFRHIPVSIMNFVEGTRFTAAKHARQASPYKHLLKPRGGGTALVLDALGDCIDTIVDVTVVYPHGRPGFLQFLSSRVPEIRVHIRLLPVPQILRGGDYQNDAEFRERFQAWLNRLWHEKDRRITGLLEQT